MPQERSSETDSNFVLKKTTVRNVLVAVAVIVMFVAYASYAEHHAARIANEFCGTLSIGEDISGLRERALASGANERQTRWILDGKGRQWLPATFTGATPIDRHICSIDARSDKITSFKYVYLD
jgi:hypothetical protein